MARLLILIALLFAAAALSLQFGSFSLSWAEIFDTLAGNGSAQQNLVLFNIRLPRLVVAALAGTGLALSGCVLQALSRNALADPGILGLNAGAGLMITLQLYAMQVGLELPAMPRPVAASVGAGGAALAVYMLARRQGQIETGRLLLCGIAINAGLSAAMLVLSMRLERSLYDAAVVWLSGSLSGRNWGDATMMLPWLAILGAIAATQTRALDLFGIGDDAATGVGLPVEARRLLLLVVAVGLAGASVATVGGIGFVGLLGPHMARRLVGPRHHLLLPASALVGSLMMVISDTASRQLFAPIEMPTGVLVAIVGAPYFLYLMLRSTR